MARKTIKTIVSIMKMDNGRWGIMKSTNKKPSRIMATQRDAISYGRDLAKRIGAEMNIYNEQGDIRRRYYR
jgi:hypothetical protein